MLTLSDLRDFEEYLTSGALAKDFKQGSVERKHEILELLEKLMDLAELADKEATGLIFEGSYLGMLTGVKAQK